MTPTAACDPAAILLVAWDHVASDPREAVQEPGLGDGGEGGFVESDLRDGGTLLEQLLADGHFVRLARTFAHARSLARGSPPDLVLIQARHRLCEALDLVREIRGVGVTEGHDVSSDARRDHGQRHIRPTPWPERVPIVVVAPRHSRVDVLRAFEAGADDYLPAPPYYLELRARLRALLERARRTQPSSIVRAGPLTIDTAARSVTREGRRPLFPPRLQYELLLALARDPQRVVARSELIRHLWGERSPDSTRTLDSHASRLRRALCADDNERWIVSVRGVGYRLR